MGFKIIIFTISLLKFINCNESESSEVKQVEMTPSYDTIVFGDVIDIVNELNKNYNSPLYTFTDSDSESDENVEDLLTEYQRFLDKAHEQRRIYLDKANQTKNKVPLLRHETYVKTNPTFEKNGNYYNTNSYYPSIFKIPPVPINNPLDSFIPVNPPLRYFNKPKQDMVFPGNRFDDYLPIIDKYSKSENKPLTLPSLYLKQNEPLKSNCMCPSAQPLCKQCLIPHNSMVINGNKDANPQYFDSNRKSFGQQNPLLINPTLSEHLLQDMDNAENTLNVKIKVDVQFPKTFNIPGSLNNKQNRDSAMEYDDTSKEVASSLKLPTTSFNFPIPFNMFAYKQISKMNKHDVLPFRKTFIHKKKKSKSNTNKKHRKKLITFHNVKISPSHSLKPLLNEYRNMSSSSPEAEYNETHKVNLTEGIKSEPTGTFNRTATSTENTTKNTTQFEESFFLMVNVSNNNENEAEDVNKTGNSIELDFKTMPNISTPTSVREKRHLGTKTINDSLISKDYFPDTNNSLKERKNEQIEKKLNLDKKPEKALFSDTDLLYWPSGSQNGTVAKAKNIMDIIIERETKKAKLNLSNEAIRRNRTIALEQAIFGQVDWDDMDAVAPTFLSFVGKYVNGILTFCSEKICHSVKCAEKTCVHRTCLPEQRFNHIGHCSGSNRTDSVASMESLMDLPSNVSFEVVDILKDKMYGKLYGKVTLCISSKCTSFVTSKKIFLKSKCSTNNLNKIGHCPNIKKL